MTSVCLRRNTFCSGIATYKIAENKFQDFSFKAFYTNDNNNDMVTEISKLTISLVAEYERLERIADNSLPFSLPTNIRQ